MEGKAPGTYRGMPENDELENMKRSLMESGVDTIHPGKFDPSKNLEIKDINQNIFTMTMQK